MKDHTLIRNALLLVISTFMLSGCGGGTSTDVAKNPVPNTSSGSTTDKFMLDAVRYNQCYIETAYQGVDVIFHDAQGNVVGANKTDSNGHFEAILPNTVKHVSVAGTKIFTDNDPTLVIQTYLDIQNIDIGKVRYIDSSDKNNCDCHTVTLDLSELNITAPEHYLTSNYLLRETLSNSGKQSETIEHCDATGPLDLLLTSPDQSEVSAAYIDLTNINELTLTRAHFEHQGVLVYAEKPDDVYTFESRAFTNNTYKFRNGTSINRNEALFIFPNINTTNLLLAYSHQVDYENGLRVDTSRYAREPIALSGDVDFLEVPELNEDFNNAVFSLVNEVAFNEAPYDFDFSYISSFMDGAELEIQWSNSDSSKVYWSILGGTSGTIPDFDIGDLTLSNDDQIIDMQLVVYLYGYGLHLNLNESRKKLAQRSRLENFFTDPAFHKYKYLATSYEMNL